MKKCIKICFVFLGLFQFTDGYSQSSTWAKDSLAYYEIIFWTKVKAKKNDEAREIIDLIEKKAIEQLDEKYFDFLEAIIKKESEIGDLELAGDIEEIRGNLEFYKGDFLESKKAFKFARDRYIKGKIPSKIAGMTMNIGIIQERLGYFDSAIFSYEQALPIFKSQNNIRPLASTYENIGLAHYRLSQFQKALDFFMKTDSLLATYLDSLDIRWIGLYMNQELALSRLNRQDEGLKVLLKGLRIAEHNQDQMMLGRVNYQLSIIYKYKGENEKQYKALLKSKSYNKLTQNLFELATVNSSLALFHLGSSYLDSAVYYAQESLSYFEPQGLIEEISNSYSVLGNVEFQKKNYEEAISFYKKALDNFNEKETQSYAGFLFDIGFAYSMIGNTKLALDYLERSLVIRKKLKVAADLRESYKGLAETYQRNGDYKRAFENLTLFQAYNDSVFTETKNKQLAELETLYETEKKDEAIADLEKEKELQDLRTSKQQAQIYLSAGGLVILLGLSGLFFRQSMLRKKHNQVLEIKNTEIAKQNAERELLLKEIHHRVKNNLQIISSLLSMTTRGLKDDKMKDAMKESQSRVKTMALIHEKLYQYENLSKINMQEYIQQLSNFLTQTYRSDKDIQITINAAEINLDMDMAIPLGLITNELLSNSLKYAFEDRHEGEIIINFSQKVPGSYSLLIKDTGKGLGQNLDIDNTKSLGLKLVKTLTRQINGQLKIIPQPGASFEIYFSDQPIAA
ncbi:MAG: histidine kinase dimerization/phosphoacceptor domain -containing protein [Algoriphagus aquaeductus]|uniref:tetratricopeptide repeat-containing sensor histidine kinase n=1 Tax=Algoriphagus aquaeductus TaxID=475299 RepID=UPI003879D742